MTRSRTRIVNVCIDQIHLSELLKIASDALHRHEQCIIFNANAHAIVLANHQPTFRDALNQADVVFCDGVGIQLASRWLGHPLPERFTPPDWIEQLAQLCVQLECSMFLLGATDESVQRARLALEHQFRGLRVHTHHGYFDKAGTENDDVIRQINASGDGVLLVGFGMPAQELWIMSNRERLRVSVILAVGALFDYLGETKPRGPRWMTNHGLEWLSRLIIEPKRLWRRYLIGLPQFVWMILKQKHGW